MKLSVREAETIIKILTPAYCPIPKQVIILIFISLIFFALYFPSQYQWFFLSLLPFPSSSWKLKKNATRTAFRLVRSTKLRPVRCSSYLDGWPNTNTPCCNNFSFFLPFRLQSSPALCDVVSSISKLFVPQFAMFAFTCIYLQHRINKMPNASFEFFSILLTFDRLKQ